MNGWASYKVADSVTGHEAWGLGIYSVFTNPGIFLTRAVEIPRTTNVKFHHLVTVNLTANVINDQGGATAPGPRRQHAPGHRCPLIARAAVRHRS